MTICGSLLIGRLIIKLVFGELWPIESQVSLCVEELQIFASHTNNLLLSTAHV